MLIMYTHDHDFIRGKTSSYFRLPVFLHPLREGKFHPSILHNDNSLSLSPPALSGISDFQLNSKLVLPTIRKNTKELGEADKVKTLFGLLQKGQGRRGGEEGMEEKKRRGAQCREGELQVKVVVSRAECQVVKNDCTPEDREGKEGRKAPRIHTEMDCENKSSWSSRSSSSFLTRLCLAVSRKRAPREFYPKDRGETPNRKNPTTKTTDPRTKSTHTHRTRLATQTNREERAKDGGNYNRPKGKYKQDEKRVSVCQPAGPPAGLALLPKHSRNSQIQVKCVDTVLTETESGG